MRTGKLILCATPIGNLDDMAPRGLAALASATVVACEDTRRTRKLLSHFGIHVRKLVIYNEANERRETEPLVERMRGGSEVILVSDAGMPGLSDPGYRLVRAAVDAGIEIEIIPGPNAAVSALVISGLPTGRFVFEGFLPRKSGERVRHLQSLADEQRTIVFYESPHRIEASLADMGHVFGPRPAALARELTKMHEEVRRGTLDELLDSVRESPPKGEIVVVVQGAVGEARSLAGPAELAAAARRLMHEGVGRQEALAQVAREQGVPKRSVFDALVQHKG